MYNCNSCCDSRRSYALYNDNWPCIWQAAQEAACAAYNAQRAAKEAERFAEVAVCAKEQIDRMLECNNRPCCHCCNREDNRYPYGSYCNCNCDHDRDCE